MNKKQVLKKLGNYVTIRNMQSINGNDVPNQVEIKFEKGSIFQSYNSIIIVKFYMEDNYYLGKAWDYSTTTGKYRNKFLNKDKKEIEQDIKSRKAILLEDL